MFMKFIDLVFFDDRIIIYINILSIVDIAIPTLGWGGGRLNGGHFKILHEYVSYDR